MAGNIQSLTEYPAHGRHTHKPQMTFYLVRTRRLLPVAAGFLLASCAGHDTAAARGNPVTPDSLAALADSAAAADSVAAVAAGMPAYPNTPGYQRTMELQRAKAPTIRALYLNRFAIQNPAKMRRLLALADSTEINGFVVDIKDEFGLNFISEDPMLQKNAGTATKSRSMKAWVDSMRAHGVLPIARIVVFKDSVAARNNPNYVIRTAEGSPWRDEKGLTWVNPYANAIWEYNFRVGDEAIRMGFGEIQFDYIRFPEPYRRLAPQVFPEQRNRGKTEALAEFLKTARERYAKRGIRTTADVFGLTTTVQGALEIGQRWEPLAQSVDVMLPMVYPSHYPRGSFGIARPNAEPYQINHTAISRARARNEAIGLNGEHVRPWLQAFTLGQPRYEAQHLRAQKEAVYDAGYDGWVWWHPGSNYDLFRDALEPKLETRKKNPPVAAGKTKSN